MLRVDRVQDSANKQMDWQSPIIVYDRGRVHTEQSEVGYLSELTRVQKVVNIIQEYR